MLGRKDDPPNRIGAKYVLWFGFFPDDLELKRNQTPRPEKSRAYVFLGQRGMCEENGQKRDDATHAAIQGRRPLKPIEQGPRPQKSAVFDLPTVSGVRL